MDIGKLLLLGGAAYIAYEYFIAPASTPAPTSPGGIQPAAVQPTVNPATSQGMVLALANKAGFTTANSDQWGTLYAQARGIPAPDPLSYLTPDTRGEILTFPEWWALASAHGLSGYRRAGMGDDSVLWGD